LGGVREKLQKVRERFGATQDPVEILSSVAQRWVLAHPNVCGVIPGFRNPKQAACNVVAGRDEPMSEVDVKWLRDLFRA
jgi:aryl-alcohol dehydrogenase-like predicted oxidoreductase